MPIKGTPQLHYVPGPLDSVVPASLNAPPRQERPWRSRVVFQGVGFTPRLLSSSFLWFIFRTLLRGKPKKELLRSLWVGVKLFELLGFRV